MVSVNIRLEENTLNELRKMSNIFKIPYSEIIRKGIEREIKEKRKSFLYKMNQFEEINQEEEKEIMQELEAMTSKDLEITKTIEVKI